jgi:Fe-S cluster biogenesis protein NfuA
MDDATVRHEIEALDADLAALEQLPPGEARDTALAAVQGLLRVYGEALRRVVVNLDASALRDDELVGHLLLLHGLHPATVEERVAAALEEVRPYIGSHGGGIELVSVSDGVARVRLHGSCQGCSASTRTLKLAVEEAVLRAAPELASVEAIDQQPVTHEPPGMALPMYGAGAR